MRRRALIKAIPALLVAGSLPAVAQQTRARRVGILLVDDPEPMGSFREALRELGYIEDGNVQVAMLSARVSSRISPRLPSNWYESRSTSSWRCRPRR
jgi:hypothetical protein